MVKVICGTLDANKEPSLFKSAYHQDIFLFQSKKKSSTEERHEHLGWHGREYNLFVIIIIIIQLYSFNLCLNGKNGKAAVELVTTA